MTCASTNAYFVGGVGDFSVVLDRDHRAQDPPWTQEGIYVAYASHLGEPSSWSRPQRLLAAGRWYPQVVGLEPDGTDKAAGEFARFFMNGRSEYVIQFSK